MGTTTWTTGTAGQQVSHAEDDVGREHSGPAGAPRYSRRLSDKILHRVPSRVRSERFRSRRSNCCTSWKMAPTRRPLTPDGTRRRNMESLVAAHERLWHLRHPHMDEN